MTSTIGIPIKLLNEAQGHIVTLEIDSGTTYRGKLIEGAARSPLQPFCLSRENEPPLCTDSCFLVFQPRTT